MKVGIVLGYGIFEESNKEYKDYLDWIIKEIQDEGINKVVLCGGYTNNTKPEISEAQSMGSYFKKVLPDFENLILEDESLTTPQNLENARKKVQDQDEFIVYGDLVRFAKIIWLSLHFLLKIEKKELGKIFFEFAKNKKLTPFNHQNLSVKAFNFPSRDLPQAISQTFSTLLEVEGVYDLELDNLITEQRKKDFGLI